MCALVRGLSEGFLLGPAWMPARLLGRFQWPLTSTDGTIPIRDVAYNAAVGKEVIEQTSICTVGHGQLDSGAVLDGVHSPETCV